MCRPAIAFLKVKKSWYQYSYSLINNYKICQVKPLQHRKVKATGVQFCRWLQVEIAAWRLGGWAEVVPEDQDFIILPLLAPGGSFYRKAPGAEWVRVLLEPVLRIHYILGWIRIRGSMPIRIRIRIRILDPDPAIFVIDLQDESKKLIFYHNFFCLLLFEGTFTSFFKDKKSKRDTK